MENIKNRILKKVIVVLDRKPDEDITAFGQMLEREQIESIWYYADEEQSESDEQFGTTKESDVEEEWGIQPEAWAQELAEEANPEGKRGVLYISCYPEICQLALEKGCSVIAYLMKNVDGCFEGIRYAIESFEDLDHIYLDRVCRRYAGLPWDILETERCVVRETTVEDVESFYRIYAEPSITKYMEGLYEEKEKEIQYTKDYIKNVYGFYEYGLWTVINKKSGEVIGRAGVNWREDTESVELGYIIAKPFQRQGYAYEVCSAILRYAYDELGIEQICAYIKRGNEASKQLCEKLQFVYQGEISTRDEVFQKWVKTLKMVGEHLAL